MPATKRSHEEMETTDNNNNKTSPEEQQQRADATPQTATTKTEETDSKDTTPKEPNRKRRRHAKGRKRNRAPNKHIPWEDVSYHNELFERFYSESEIIPPSEWKKFMDTIKVRLPTTFRINTASPFASSIHKQIEDHFVPIFEAALEIDGEKIDPPKPVPWYPDSMAWYLSVSRSTLRKDPALSTFHKFLVMHNEHGNISRQEEVSMLPPFFLDVQPHHRILDMCAAPGSKTAQLLEMLRARATSEQPLTGYVVANDSDQKRCYLLVHQLQRLTNLFPHVIITNHDARRFPNLLTEGADGNIRKEKFDRVLCDVICSGDGTIRKSLNVWKSWNPQQGPNLHPLQIDIASRGIQVLRPGGRMVYSTCSMNPVEDEAVVAELLRRYKGKVRLSTAGTDAFPNLQYERGLSSWRVMSKRGKWYSNVSELPPEASRLTASMFAPTEEEAAWMNLDRCMRLLPHRGDTGGFFVAVFENVEDVEENNGGENAEDSAAADAAEQGKEEIQYFKGKSTKEGEGHFSPLDSKTEELLRDFYQIRDTFDFGQVMCRSQKEGSRKLFFVSPSVRRAIENNEKNLKWRVVNAGLRVFERSDSYSRCKYRITQEGAAVLAPHMGSRLVKVSIEDMSTVLDNDKTSISDLSAEAAQALQEFETGTVVLHTQGKAGNTVYTVVFRGEKTLNRMVKKTEIGVIRFALDPTYIPPPKERKPASPSATPDAAEGSEAKSEDNTQ